MSTPKGRASHWCDAQAVAESSVGSAKHVAKCSFAEPPARQVATRGAMPTRLNPKRVGRMPIDVARGGSFPPSLSGDRPPTGRRCVKQVNTKNSIHSPAGRVGLSARRGHAPRTRAPTRSVGLRPTLPQAGRSEPRIQPNHSCSPAQENRGGRNVNATEWEVPERGSASERARQRTSSGRSTARRCCERHEPVRHTPPPASSTGESDWR